MKTERKFFKKKNKGKAYYQCKVAKARITDIIRQVFISEDPMKAALNSPKFNE